MFFYSEKGQNSLQSEQAVEDVDSQLHFHNSSPAKLDWLIRLLQSNTEKEKPKTCVKQKLQFTHRRSYTMRERFSMLVSIILPELDEFERLCIDKDALCSITPWLSMCLTRIWTTLNSQYTNRNGSRKNTSKKTHALPNEKEYGYS